MSSRFLYAFCISYLSMSSTQLDGQWKRYAPKEAGLEAMFPAEPSVRKMGQGSGTIMIAAVPRAGVEQLGYMCQWLLREEPFGSKEAEKIYLLGQQAGAVRASKGKLLQASAITLGDNLGREFTIELSEQNVLRSRVYLAGKRVIHLSVLGKDKDAVQSKEAKKFFDSIKISK